MEQAPTQGSQKCQKIHLDEVHVADALCKLGEGTEAWAKALSLGKADIKASYWIVLVHPDDRLLAMQWDGQVYICRQSSPIWSPLFQRFSICIGMLAGAQFIDLSSPA